MKRHLKTRFLFLVRLSLNNQLKILIWEWNQILNLLVRLLKVLKLHRKQLGVKLVNTLLCSFSAGFYWFCYNLIHVLTNVTLLFVSVILCTQVIDQIIVYIDIMWLMQKRMMFFVAVLFAAYEARFAIFNNVSFGKTIETKFIFFYKLSSFRDTSILKTGTVHQSMIIFTKPTF